MHSICDTELITSDEIPRDLLRDRKIIRFRVIIRFGLTPVSPQTDCWLCRARVATCSSLVCDKPRPLMSVSVNIHSTTCLDRSSSRSREVHLLVKPKFFAHCSKSKLVIEHVHGYVQQGVWQIEYPIDLS